MKKLKTLFQKLGSWIVAHKVRFFLIAGVIAAIVILLLDYLFLNASNKADVIVEAHGMLFDIILFGIILTVYEAITDKRDRVKRYKEELDDFRGWKGEEAAFRVAGLVKRLLKEGVENIDLANLHVGQLVQIIGNKGKELIEKTIQEKKRFCSMQGAELWGFNLEGAFLSAINFKDAKLWEVNLKGVNLVQSNLQGANLIKADLTGANLSEVNMEGAKLWEVNLKGAHLWEANLKGVNLTKVNLEGAYLGEANMEGTKAYKYQKTAFSKIMTVEQLNSMIWIDASKEEEKK